MTAVTRERLAYSLPEAAEATGLSVETIRRAVNASRLPTHQPEGVAKRLILRADLERWLRGN